MGQTRIGRSLVASVVLAGNLVLAAPATPVATPVAAATVPPGFTDAIVAGGITNPTAMAFAPDGRLFVAQQGGALRVIKNGSLLATPFVTLTVNSSGERGLLGVAVDPDFAINHWVYVYYTATSPGVHNRVSRFTANGDVAVPGSETVVLELPNLGATNHNGGAIHFGPDGKLYVATGENVVPSYSQSFANMLGKMLRINRNGSIPTDNPFYGSASGMNRTIWALGLRNPFTFAFQPSTGRMFINDVGQVTWEEINDGIRASNYGWPASEGPTGNPAHRGPLVVYGHGNGPVAGCAVAGAAFYNPVAPTFPASFVGDYYFADLCGGAIYRVSPPNFVINTFATGIDQPVDLQVGPDGSLYYLARGSGGVVGRIAFPTTPPSPTETTFVPVSPVRVLDTRDGTGLTGPFMAGTPRTWPVAGIGGLPANAVAVTGNVTVTAQTGSGWVTVSPTPSANASPSTVNMPLGDDRANNVTIALGPSGSLSAVYASTPGRTAQLVFDVTGYFVASNAGATYQSLGPVRSLDTRAGNGLTGPFATDVPRTWQVAGQDGIPADAVAVTGNVTVTGQTSAGFVSVTPEPDASPATSTLNFPVADDRANGLTVELASDGTLSAVFQGGTDATTHLVFDVTGYYLDDLTGARFVPLVPGRVLDSRVITGLAGPFASGSPRVLTLVPGSVVPSTADAITGNLTVANARSKGFVALTELPTASPGTSTLNFPSGDTRANGITAPMSSAGTVALVHTGTSGSTTDLILDVTGYFE
jgi:glucose/arabinose dehydrogenase